MRSCPRCVGNFNSNIPGFPGPPSLCSRRCRTWDCSECKQTPLKRCGQRALPPGICEGTTLRLTTQHEERPDPCCTWIDACDWCCAGCRQQAAGLDHEMQQEGG